MQREGTLLECSAREYRRGEPLNTNPCAQNAPKARKKKCLGVSKS